MSDVKFELNYMHSIYKDFNEVAIDIRDSLDDFSKAISKTEAESASFAAEGRKASNDVSDYIHQIDDDIRIIKGKKQNALSKKKSEIPLPPPPSIPSDASEETKTNMKDAYDAEVSRINKANEKIREDNKKIDAYVVRCDKAIKELEALIVKLQKINTLIKKTVSQKISQVQEYLSVKGTCISESRIINDATIVFTKAFNDTIESATRLAMYNAIKLNANSYIDRQFVIKNTHTHSTSSFSFDFSSLDFAQVEKKSEKIEKTKSDEEILVKERNETVFFTIIAGVTKFRMPSSNLHRLGGKKFTAQMQALGYELVTLADGSTIDNSGMLHWEKKDD